MNTTYKYLSVPKSSLNKKWIFLNVKLFFYPEGNRDFLTVKNIKATNLSFNT